MHTTSTQLLYEQGQGHGHQTSVGAQKNSTIQTTPQTTPMCSKQSPAVMPCSTMPPVAMPLCYRCTQCVDRCTHCAIGALIMLIGAHIVLPAALIVLIGVLIVLPGALRTGLAGGAAPPKVSLPYE